MFCSCQSRAPRAIIAWTVALGALVLAPPASADPSAFPLRHFLRQTWQTAEGLPQNSVRAIVQTRDGYIWFATAEGLVRFDGVRFTVFNRTSTPALPSNNIGALVEGRDGALWIGLRRGGLARLAHGRIQKWTTEEGLSSNAVVSILETRDGTVWAGTYGDGLNRLENGRIRVYRKAEGLPDDFAHHLSEASDGSLWIATGGGVARFADGRFTTVTRSDGLPHDSANVVLHDRQGRVWIGTAAGLACLENGRLLPGAARALPTEDVMALTEGSDGSLWIGTRSGGLAHLVDGRIDTLSSADGLPDDFVRALLQDREGNLWVGLNAGGLSRLRPTPFRTVSKRDGLPSDFIRAVHEGRDGSMWVATSGFGLVRVKDGRVTRWTMRQGLPHDAISAIGEASDGTIWVGTGNGLAHLRPFDRSRASGASRAQARDEAARGRAELVEGHDGRITRYTTKDGLPQEHVRAVLEDRRGRVWIGTNGGVCWIDGLRCVPVPALPGIVRALHEGADGAMWAGGHGALRRYHNDVVTTWTTTDGLSSEFITSVVEDHDGVLWIGTAGGGLNRFERGRITTYRMEHGLFDDVVYRALPDGQGWVWMTSNRGLFRVARSELDAFAANRTASVQTQVYAEGDGLPTSEFNGGSFPAGVVTRNGHLWLPSIRGVVQVDPRGFSAPAAAPTVTLEHVQVDGRAYDPERPLEAPPGTGRFELQYTALNFTAPGKIRFRYMLEGFDREWVEAGARRVAYYTNVPPGDYRLRVMSSNEAGQWTGRSTALAVRLQPHFYQTTWFYAGAVVILALGAFGGARLRARHARARERCLVELVDARTRALREEIAERRSAEAALVDAREVALAASRLKSEFIANVSHEIRTPMNGVIGMTDLALEGPLSADVRGCLETVRSSADALLHVINDILDFSKIEAGKVDLTPEDFGLRALLDQIVAPFQPRAVQKGLDLRCEVEDGIPDALVADSPRLRQVLTNLVGNALKFTERGEIRLVVARGSVPLGSADRTALRFGVTDTGMGIAPEQQKRVFEAFTQADGSTTRRFGGTGLGLTISSRLVRLMGGELTVASAPGQGSTFAFTIPVGVGGAVARPGAERAVTPLARGRRLVVLLAEDNRVNQIVAARVLEKAGHSVTIVDSGTAAVEAVVRNVFDVVLMDVQMPGMNGFDATRAIRAHEQGQRRVPIVALTAHAMRGDRERCLEAGMDGYVSKPVRAPELFAALADVVRSADAA